ncbi:hypothetical protein [Limobrevibacterium gyesilva]|uniref:hypothetical protein n=1 Tax=Limobrevibacterium gyesilva TaxID=2991712 RepID=UPI002226ECC3|nr:hypothetical protein [Limobrevibacterium gyesilva]
MLAVPAIWRRRLLTALLLPVALVVVVLEDVVWAGALIVLRRLAELAAIRALATALRRLPGWAALPLFLVPEGVGRVGELWAVVLLVHGHTLSAALVYVLVRLLATLMAVFVYHACEPALLRIRWFAVLVGWARRVRDWAKARLQPLRARIRMAGRTAPGLVVRRFVATRRWIERRWLRLAAWSRR